ncbi:DNA replication protein DnaC [Buchnera aphidicola]|uniref:DNA replication protein DnaC n=1 Tax=Buchnera aphidicola TaxID=9 RepID=UPI0031B837B9
MYKYKNFLKKLKKIMPNNIKPKFKNEKELFFWNQKQGIISSKTIIKKNKIKKIKKNFNQSGIKKLYINCSFNNYKIFNQGQKKALLAAKKYAKKFHKNIANFIFSGKSGTGKNHLASAIGNYLIINGKSVLIVTVADLMSNMKNTFNKKNNTTEEKLLNKLSTVDLLIIDEIGIQTESRYEKIIINQIVDRRSSSKLSTGMLSNLDYKGMNILLGERVIDRMRLGNSLWVNFEWESYRKNIKN